MKLKIYILTLFALGGIKAIAQPNKSYPTNPDWKRGFNWMFGDSIWLDFKTNPPVEKNGSVMAALESATSYSDTAGNLVLYSDGVTVWNKNHKIIKGGTGLFGNESSSQGSIFIPQPGNDSIVYLFTTDAHGGPKGFCYNKIKINSNLDSSEIIEKNIKLVPWGICESISATKHANGIWTWVAVHNSSGQGIISFLITENGINKCPVFSKDSLDFHGDNINVQSVSAFSHSGNLYAITAIADFKVEFLFFDNSTGRFSNATIFYNIDIPTGLVFTANDKFCFVIERDYRLLRVNCSTLTSMITVDDHNATYMMLGARMSPYRQILIGIDDSLYLGTVDSAETNTPHFIKKALTFSKISVNELPNFENSYTFTPGANFTYHLDCSTNEVTFEGTDTFNADVRSYMLKRGSNWDIMGNGKAKLKYKFTDTGNFKVQYWVKRGNMIDTMTKTIPIRSKIPKDFLGRDTGYCAGNFPSLTLNAPNGMQCYRWWDDSSVRSKIVNKAGRYIATITTPNFCQISDTINLYEDTMLPKPVITRKGDSLMTTAIAGRYIWMKDNLPVATSKSIKMTQTGIYQLSVMQNGGCPVLSDTINVNELSVSSIADIKDIKIVPNPASEIISINGLDPLQSYTITISDVAGKIIKTLKTGADESPQISLHDLTNGMYIISINSNQRFQKTLKLIKQ